MIEFTAEEIAKLSDEEQEELLALMEQELKEVVSPKLEAFRDPIIGGDCNPKYRIRGARGGRGAGAKSHSMVSLIVQRANVEPIDIICLREIQGSIDESVKKLIEDKIEFLGYKDWKILKTSIEGPEINGKRSHIIFKGLKDLRASTNVKGLEGYKIAFVEEAATISMESWNLLLPTIMRTLGAQLWFAYNPELEDDPVTVKIWDRDRDDALLIELKPGKEDNPWWNDGLQKEMEEDFKADPVEADHIWNGNPRSQGDSAIFSRVEIDEAMCRNIPAPVTNLVVGCDVARFGDDRTAIFVRKGMKVVDYIVGKKWDTMYIAKKCRDMGKMDPTTVYNIDGGAMGPGVIDRLRELGEEHVNEINFGGAPRNKEKYTSIADELWFNFKDIINEVDIPDLPELKSELAGRQYNYDNRGRKKIESKADYKKRRGKSPDLADALLLCYNQGVNTTFDDDIINQMRKRRKRAW
jgi:phage terminase large subunit